MKVINLIKESKTSDRYAQNLSYLKQFRAISALEGLHTSANHSRILEDLATGRLSKQDYVKARMKLG